MKKAVLLLVYLTLAIMLTGCMQGKIHLTVHKNGTADISIKFGTDPAVASFSSNIKDPLNELYKSAKESGFSVKRFDSKDNLGMLAQKHYQKLSDLLNVDKNAFLGKFIKSDSEFTVNKGLFYDTYRLNSGINLKSLRVDEKGSELEKSIQKAVLSQIRFDLFVTLPIEAKDSNARKVLDNGKTYMWSLLPGKNNEIYLEAEVPNVRNMIIIGSTIVALFACLGFIYIRGKRTAF